MISRKQEYKIENPSQNPTKMPVFPRGTIFGASTSAYQVEGCAGDNGRSPSIWDTFSHSYGKTRNGATGDAASEHCKRYIEDVSIMGRLGLDAYNFSISWPRIMPEGRININNKGLDFYDRLTDELMKAGIRPFASLYHWDYPQQLFRETGGFMLRRSALYFADYAEVVVKKLGDRIKDWITISEPRKHTVAGYILGEHAPGLHRPVYFGRVIHNQLLSHALAMERIKGISPAARVGISLDLLPPHPKTDTASDLTIVDYADQLLNRLFLDPLFTGEYPHQVNRLLGPFFPEVKPEDMAAISRPLNFLGVTLNSRVKVSYAPWLPLIKTVFHRNRVPYKEYIKNDVRYTSTGTEVYPEAVYESLIKIRDNYGNIPVYVTGNGAAFTDKLVDYRIRDYARINFLSEYTAQAAKAAAEGCDLRGYFVRSLLDGFEWNHGYSKQFGLVHVDFKTQRRKIKDSGYWFADLINANRL